MQATEWAVYPQLKTDFGFWNRRAVISIGYYIRNILSRYKNIQIAKTWLSLSKLTIEKPLMEPLKTLMDVFELPSGIHLESHV